MPALAPTLKLWLSSLGGGGSVDGGGEDEAIVDALVLSDEEADEDVVVGGSCCPARISGSRTSPLLRNHRGIHLVRRQHRRLPKGNDV